MVGPRTALVTAAFVLALGPTTISGLFSSSQAPGPGAKVCGLLPIPELETLYHAKAGALAGTDASSLSTCTVTIAGQAVKVASARPGTAGLPATIEAGLAASAAMTASGKSGITQESKDYGDVGCRRTTMTQDLDKKPLPKPMHSTSCFQITGGYLILTLVSDKASIVTDDHVKTLLAKAAARR
jgi:hypothetical protein